MGVWEGGVAADMGHSRIDEGSAPTERELLVNGAAGSKKGRKGG